MGWSRLPVAPGDEVRAGQMEELRAAIVERRRAVGMGPANGAGDPPEVAAGGLCLAETLNACRRSVEEVIPYYCREDHTGLAWTKDAVIAAALGAGRSDWTRVPGRAGGGGLVEGPSLSAGDVIYAEHVNDMREVVRRLYIVPLEEKPGRQFCRNLGQNWEWSDGDYDPSATVCTAGNHQTGQASETGESAPFDFQKRPLVCVTAALVEAVGSLAGSGGEAGAKFVNFVNGMPDDEPPSDRAWAAQLRVSGARPAASPRGEDTAVTYETNVADDGTHDVDWTGGGANYLEVHIADEWERREITPVPEAAEWPFWLTFVMDDCEGVTDAWAAEAAASGRQLQVFSANAHFSVGRIWAELEMEYP